MVGAFATSSNTFLIKSINVQPASAATAAPGDLAGMSPGAQPVQPATGKGGLQTVLKEQLLRISLEVGLVKLLPKS